MAISYATITTLMEAATTALAAGDYATARDKALAAQGVLAILPDTSRNSSGGGSDSATWDRVALSTFLENATRLANAQLGVQSSVVRLQPLSFDGKPVLGVM